MLFRSEGLISADVEKGASIQTSGGTRIIDWFGDGVTRLNIASGAQVTMISTNITVIDPYGDIGGPYTALTTNIDTSVSQTLIFVNGLLVSPP